MKSRKKSNGFFRQFYQRICPVFYDLSRFFSPFPKYTFQLLLPRFFSGIISLHQIFGMFYSQIQRPIRNAVPGQRQISFIRADSAGDSIFDEYLLLRSSSAMDCLRAKSCIVSLYEGGIKWEKTM